MTSSGVRLYGRVLGHGSLSVVTAGFRSTLEKAGLLAGVFGTDVQGIEALESIDGSDARVGVYVGHLDAVGKMFEQGRHEEHFVMVTPNSDQLPPDLVRTLKRYRDKFSVRFMAPSAWAAGIVESFLGQCINVPHGISPEYTPSPSASQEMAYLAFRRQLRVIHFSTSDRQRKGTLELIQAWAMLRQDSEWDPREVALMCVMDYPAKLALEEVIADGAVLDWPHLQNTVRLVDRADLSPSAMATTLRNSHLVCQPSRGEGFGLIPLQALACGVPVVATTTTGHSEYLGPDTGGLIPVATTEPAPIDDLPWSLAPAVAPEAIAAALLRARACWPAIEMLAQAQASEWQTKWSWEASLAAFVKMIQ